MIGSYNTVIIKESEVLKVILHSTVIYSEQNGIITLNDGGWTTATTARRMNQCLEDFGYSHIIVHRLRGYMYAHNTKNDYKTYFDDKGRLTINTSQIEWRA